MWKRADWRAEAVLIATALAALVAIVVFLRRRGYVLKLTRRAVLHLALLVLVSVCVFLVIRHWERQRAAHLTAQYQ